MLYQSSAEKLILASGSPRRRQMLEALGLVFQVIVADIDEAVLDQESADSMVQRLARAKAQEISRRFPTDWVLAADTTVVVDREILGKPRDRAEARSMLKQLSGREHQVLSAFTLINAAKGVAHDELHISKVSMINMSEQLIDDYVATTEPLDKAGAYAIQGLGSALIERIEGSYTNVVGLNLSAVVEALRKFGYIK